MKTGGRIALGVGAGYLLGRTRKMRLALMIAAAGATGTVGSPRQLVQRGLKQLASSQELGKLTEVARDELMNAAKAAAVTAASSRIDSLNERLQDRSSGVTKGLGKARGRQEDSEEGTEEGTEENPGDTAETESGESSRSAHDGHQETPARGRDRRQPAKRATKRARSADGGEDSPRRSSRTRTSSTRTPVRRTGR
ncbi:hypothetical protein [Amycolatopsis pigmentata]|uniref:Uncharacterized protein n=1 Tax=Amycolatopsis pigmentata TaxID=450801 RepID=A0ABW5G1C6_9PSEU